MKYLIIGASGFLGGTIYYKLKQLGQEVIGTYLTNKSLDELVKIDLLNPDSILNLYKFIQEGKAGCYHMDGFKYKVERNNSR